MWNIRRLLNAIAQSARDKAPIMNNTLATFNEDDGSVSVEYLGTEIVRVFPDNTAQLFTGGFDTPATLRRLRDISGARIIKYKGELMIVYPFAEGIRVDQQGRVIDGAYAAPETVGDSAE